MAQKNRKTTDGSEGTSAAQFLPEKMNLKSLQEASKYCQGCDLFKYATQTVFGEGVERARIMFIGEQPGDVEDKQGRPFVGPAGKLLMKALQAANIDPEVAYFTNAVKHFKYEWRGKRRIHSKPRRIEVLACVPWLEAEIAVVRPDVIVCLGATASQALFGSNFKLTQHRGQFIPSLLAKRVMATVHPSSILRVPDSESRHRDMELFILDLKTAAETLDSLEK